MDFTFGAPTFPAGASVSVYVDRGQIAQGAPQGTVVTSATVSAGSVLTFTGLAQNTSYFAVASVGGVWRWARFSTPDVLVPYPTQVQENGTDLPVRSKLNAGVGITASDDADNDRTLLTVTGGSFAAFWDPHDFGAIGDGALHPLNVAYASLAAAQVDFPWMDSGGYAGGDMDWAAIQHCLKLATTDSNPNPLTAGGAVILRPLAYGLGRTLNMDGYANVGLIGPGNGGHTDGTPRLVWRKGASSGTIIQANSIKGCYFAGFHLHAQDTAYDGIMFDCGSSGSDPLHNVIERIAIGYPGQGSPVQLLRTVNWILSRISDVSFAGGVRQLNMLGNYQVANVIERCTHNGGSESQVNFDVSGVVENIKIVQSRHEPAGALGCSGDITVTNGTIYGLDIDGPWFGDHSGQVNATTGCVIRLTGGARDVNIRGYRNSGLATGAGSHVELGAGGSNIVLEGHYDGGNGLKAIGGASQNVDLTRALFNPTAPDLAVVNPSNLAASRGIPFAGGLWELDKGVLVGRAGTIAAGDTTTEGVLLGSIPSSLLTNILQALVAYVSGGGDAGSLVVQPRSNTGSSEVKLRAGAPTAADRVQARPDGVILRTADDSIGFRVTDAGVAFNGGTLGQPAVASDATDLATALTLVNDLKAKLRTLGLLA